MNTIKMYTKWGNVFLFGFISYSLISTQVVPLLTDIGYDPLQRGIIIAFGALLSFFLQLYVGFLSDKYHKLKIMFMIGLVLIILFTYTTYSYQKVFFWYHFIMIGILSALYKTQYNLLETWSIRINDTLTRNFGLIRVFGSIGWAIGSVIVSYLIVHYGYKAIAVVNFGLSIVILFQTMFLPKAKIQIQNTSLQFKEIGILFKNKNYRILIVVYFLLFLAYNTEAITVTDKILIMGGSNYEIGLKWGYQAIIEIPLMIGAAYIFKKYNHKKILILTCVLQTIRFFGYAMATTITTIFIFTTIQAISFPLILISQKILVDNIVPQRLQNSGQLAMLAISGSITLIVAPILSGFLARYLSFSNILYIVTILQGISIIYSLMFKYKKNE